MAIRIETPLTEEKARALKSGDSVLLSGTVYTARDAAHKRIVEAMEAGKPLPFDPENAVVYYVGPTPAKPGQAIGSAGPTTSYRMDAYSPALIARGQRGMIGKGKRGPRRGGSHETARRGLLRRDRRRRRAAFQVRAHSGGDRL